MLTRAVKISLRNAAKTYRTDRGQVPAIENLSLDIHEGEFVVLVGPSGSGKTTTINVLAGYIPLTSGEALMDGKPLAGPGPSRVVVFQEDALFPWCTVRENIAYGPRLRGIPRARQDLAVNEYLHLLHLAEFADHFPKALSDGMKKRVELARAWACNPDVFLFDEPFGSLDVITRIQMEEIVQHLWLDRGNTVVLVSHDLEQALFLADKIVVLTPRPGRINTIMEVPFARPRSVCLRTSPDFQEMRRQLLEWMVSHE